MNFFSFTSIFVFLFNFATAVFMFLNSRGDKKNVLWGFICLAASFWGLGGFIFSMTERMEIVVLGFRVSYIGVMLTPAIFLHFVYEYLYLQKRKLVIFVYIFSFLFLSIAFFTDRIFWGGFQYVYNQFYWHDWVSTKSKLYFFYYFAVCWIIVPYSLFLLIRGMKVQSGKQAQQIKYLFVGSSVGWIGYEIMWFTDFHVYLYPYNNICIVFFPILIAYYVYKHQVLDIRFVLQKGLVYSVLVAIITAIYSIIVYGLGNMFQGVARQQSFAFNVMVIFFIALLFNPIKDVVQHQLDKKLFNGTLESLEKDKLRLQQDLFQAEKLAYVGQLASSVVHEIRNPLTAIKTYLDVLPQKYNEPTFQERFNQLIPKEIGRIEGIANQLLLLAKQRSLVFTDFHVEGLIDSTLDLLTNHFQIKNIEIQKEYTFKESIRADQDQIKQVFLNLFLNAVQAMDEGGVLRVVTKKIIGPSVSAQITVQDDGSGIPEEQLQTFFKPFQTTKKDGIGLGLTISQEIISAHGGSIGVESKIGGGTTFTIDLPIG